MEEQCPTCKLIDKICYWGDMPIKKWKRPILYIISLVFFLGWGLLFVLLMISFDFSDIDLIVTALLSFFLMLLGLLGLKVSIIGCDRCVARIFGSW